MSLSPKFQLNISHGGREIDFFSVGQCKNCTLGVVERESSRVERESSRAHNYNAYHKLAVAVAEAWGLAIESFCHSEL